MTTNTTTKSVTEWSEFQRKFAACKESYGPDMPNSHIVWSLLEEYEWSADTITKAVHKFYESSAYCTGDGCDHKSCIFGPEIRDADSCVAFMLACAL